MMYKLLNFDFFSSVNVRFCLSSFQIYAEVIDSQAYILYSALTLLVGDKKDIMACKIVCFVDDGDLT